MTLTFAVLVAAVWSGSRLVVKDSVFDGTRRAFHRAIQVAIGGVGPGSAGDRWTLRAMERRTKRSRDASGMRRRVKNMESQRAQRIGVRYRRAKEDDAASQWGWLLIGAVYTRLSPSTLGVIFWEALHLLASLVRLLAEKVRDGSTCMWCVSVWLAAPAVWIWGPHGFKLWFLWFMGVAGAARLFMQLFESLEGSDG